MFRLFRLLTLLLLPVLAACNLSAAATQADPITTPITAAENLTHTPQSTPTDLATPAPTTIAAAPTAQLPQADCPRPTGWIPYVVVRGDTLFSIAGRAGTTVDALVEANCLANANVLETGQTVYTPYNINPLDEATARQQEQQVPPGRVRLEMYQAFVGDPTGLQIGCEGVATAQIMAFDGLPTGSIAGDIQARLTAMFSFDNGNTTGQPGAFNPFINSSVTVQQVTVDNGHATIVLSGQMLLSGVCMDALMEDLLLINVFFVPQIQSAMITLDGRNVKQIFDASGLVPADAIYTRADITTYD